VNGRTTCVWSEDDCPGAGTEPHITYYPASYAEFYKGNSGGLPGITSDTEGDEPTVNVDRLCTCDKVHTGACVKKGFNMNNDGDWTCAVSADSCDAETVFHDWEQVVLSGKVCRLCPWFDKHDVDSAPIGNVWRLMHHRDGNGDHNQSQDSDATCQAGVAVGVAVAGILFAVLVLLSVYVVQIIGQERRIQKEARMKNGTNDGAKAFSDLSFDGGVADAADDNLEVTGVVIDGMNGGSTSSGIVDDKIEPKPCENGTMA